MPRPIPVEFRRRAVALVRAGKPITTAAVELGVSAAAIHNWVRQDQIARGERPGITTPENGELSKAKKRIRQLEEEVKTLSDVFTAHWATSHPKTTNATITLKQPAR
jgi:transposase